MFSKWPESAGSNDCNKNILWWLIFVTFLIWLLFTSLQPCYDVIAWFVVSTSPPIKHLSLYSCLGRPMGLDANFKILHACEDRTLQVKFKFSHSITSHDHFHGCHRKMRELFWISNWNIFLNFPLAHQKLNSRWKVSFVAAPRLFVASQLIYNFHEIVSN